MNPEEKWFQPNSGWRNAIGIEIILTLKAVPNQYDKGGFIKPLNRQGCPEMSSPGVLCWATSLTGDSLVVLGGLSLIFLTKKPLPRSFFSQTDGGRCRCVSLLCDCNISSSVAQFVYVWTRCSCAFIAFERLHLAKRCNFFCSCVPSSCPIRSSGTAPH